MWSEGGGKNQSYVTLSSRGSKSSSLTQLFSQHFQHLIIILIHFCNSAKVFETTVPLLSARHSDLTSKAPILPESAFRPTLWQWYPLCGQHLVALGYPHA